MNGSFNGQILVDKLAKLNNSQQSIETLSHWCIFHRNNAKQVVETWEREFHCVPKDKRVSFLYLANDILQNSRRKGMEFITEFWRVLPDALSDVLKNGDEFGRNAVMRLVCIWEDRKVFGSRGQILKEEILGRNMENTKSDGKSISYKLKQPDREQLEKLISSFEHIYSAPLDEDTLFEKCQIAISYVDKVENEYRNNPNLGNDSGSVIGELQLQHSSLRESIEQLKSAESSRTNLISNLRVALNEQELKFEQIRNQLQVAQSRYKQADIIFQKLLSYNMEQLPVDQMLKESASVVSSSASPGFVMDPTVFAREKIPATQAMYTREGPVDNYSSSRAEGDNRKTAAAEVAAKLAASPSSAQMLSYVLSSLASEGAMSQTAKEENPSDSKRPKLENVVPSYVPPLPPHFPHPDILQKPPPLQPQSSSTMQSSPTVQSPSEPPTSLPQTPSPSNTIQFMQTSAGSMTGVPHNYGSAPFTPQHNYPMVVMPPFPGSPNQFQNFQVREGGFFSQPPFPAAPPPMTRQ
ncbi:uncharacterized protein [Typha angustifolia]|uniref:uncharacterized protein isoform X1 n=2 Tax=Typha angustifolia TaxID=59011 RepID=UPI003C2E947B